MRIWLLKIAEMQHQSGPGSEKTDSYGWDKKKRRWFLTRIVLGQPSRGLRGAKSLFACKMELAKTD